LLAGNLEVKFNYTTVYFQRKWDSNFGIDMLAMGLQGGSDFPYSGIRVRRAGVKPSRYPPFVHGPFAESSCPASAIVGSADLPPSFRVFIAATALARAAHSFRFRPVTIPCRKAPW
jgi:hypothetical protein